MVVWACASLVGGAMVSEAKAQAPSAKPAEPAESDENLDIQGLFEKAGNLMEEGRWEEAIKPLEKIIADYGPSGYQDFGPAFGVMYYRYGFCLKNLKRFDEALKAYEQCYNGGKNAPDTPKDKLNPVWELSLLEMGVIKQAQGNYADAIKDYEAFASRPAAAGTYDDAAFRVQVATCYSKAGQPDRAKAILEQLFAGVGTAKARPDALFRAFLALVESWTTPGVASADTEMAAHQFIDANLDRMRMTAYDMARFEFNNRLLALARTASENGQGTLAIRLISMMASTGAVLQDLEGRAARYSGAVPELLRKEIEKYTQQLTAADSLDWVAKLILAAAYERLGNFAAGYAIYSEGIIHASKSPHRAIMLFGGMRCALATGQADVARSLGAQFRKEFPNHEYASSVNTLMLENLFFSKQYEESLRLANEIRASLPQDSSERDLTDFVAGASLFNLNRIGDARTELESHAKRFPESRFKEPVRYYEASALVRLKDWKAAGEKLDAFLKDFPESEYLGYAMLDRATCHFQLGGV